jgi:hypothetical protein
LSLEPIGGILIYMKDEAREKLEFEVFLSHNSQDRRAVHLCLLTARTRS